MKPKILLLDEIYPRAQEILQQEFDCRSDWKLPDMIYVGLTPIKTLVPVICPCTGIEHVESPNVIYLDNAWKIGEGRNVTSTGEHTISLILQLAKIKQMQLYNKTLGIIGHGRIGSQVHSFACSMFRKIRYYSPNSCNREIEDVLKESDIVTLHIPLNNETKGMIGKHQLELMKPGALLINTSRQGIINLNDLTVSLNKGHLGGYADDFLNDCVVPCRNVIQTPHIGGNCLEAREATDIYVSTKAVEYWRSKNT
jgi:phosphoglycerate dehydrogenase-like enzyme